MARTRPTARLRPRPSSMEVEDPTPKKQKTSKVLEVSGLSDLGIINRILGFALVYSFPIKRAIGYSGYSARPCVFSAYPVLYREPIGSGALPLALSNGDVGYFLGASDPSNIRTAIIAAYVETHPGCNSVTCPWENWDIYKFNKLYYGQTFFEKNGDQDVDELATEILTSYDFGGTVDRPSIAQAKVSSYKKHKLAIMLCDAYAKKAPDNIPEPNFFTAEELSELRVAYSDNIKHKKEMKLEKKGLAADVEKREELSDEE